MRDVPIVTLDFLAGLLRRRRKTHDRRPFRRAAVARTQAKLVLGWFRDAARVAALGRDHKICRATARRSSHEGIDVLAAQATETGNHAWYSGKDKKIRRQHPSLRRDLRIPDLDLPRGAGFYS